MSNHSANGYLARRRATPTGRRGIMGSVVCLAVAVAGCATNGDVEVLKSKTDPNLYLDAQFCQSVAARNASVRLNTPGVAAVSLPTGYDSRHFGECMIERGWSPKVTYGISLALAECRSESDRARMNSDDQKRLHIGQKFDQAAFEDCLEKHGFKGKVVVQPLEPVPSPRK